MKKLWLMMPSEIREVLSRMREMWPVTTGGLLFGLLLYSASTYLADQEKDFIARNAVESMGLVALASGIATLLATGAIFALLITRSSATPAGQWETGEQRPTGFTLPSMVWWPFVQVSLSWVEPGAEITLVKVRNSVEEHVRFLQRGRHRHIVRAITIRGLFGLFAITLRTAQPCDYRVIPTRSQLAVSAELMMADGDGHGHPQGDPVGDLVETRRYAPGDPIRLVLWKAYARSRRLLVRDHESAISVLPSATAYFLSGPDDEPSATTARTVLESGILGDDLSFGADGTHHVSKNTAGALEAIIDSVHHRHRGGEGLAGFISSVDRGKLRRCLLFVPSVSGPWLTTLKSVIPTMPGRPVIFVTVDGGLHKTPSRYSVFQKSEGPEDGQLSDLLKTLDALGGSLQIVHHGESRTLSSSELRALMS